MRLHARLGRRDKSTGRGDVFVRLKKDKVVQIESAPPPSTPPKLTTFDHPEKIASAYKDMKAYTC